MDRENYIEEIKGFLREVKEHQDRELRKVAMEEDKFKAADEGDNSRVDEDVVVPH